MFASLAKALRGKRKWPEQRKEALKLLFRLLCSTRVSLKPQQVSRALQLFNAYRSVRVEPCFSEAQLEILCDEVLRGVLSNSDIYSKLLSEGSTRDFPTRQFRYPCQVSEFELTCEIWVDESYFSESSRSEPLFIDAGVHA